MAFPASPTDGQTYSNNGTTYVYSTGLGVWDVQGASSAASGVTSVAGRTGTVTLTATDVSLANVTNESKATMFTNPTLTGTTTLSTVSAGAITASSLSLSGALTVGSLSGVSALNSITIGATTPSTGAFTTLSASSTLTGVAANFTGSATYSGNNKLTFGPNSSWAQYLQIGGNGIDGSYAQIAASNGNLHLESLGAGYPIYLNYYRGGGVNVNGTLAVSGAITATTTVTAYYSDDRLKTQINTIKSALDKIDQLTGFIYVENDLARSFGFNNTDQQVALSAQAVRRVQPEAVKPAPFDTNRDGTSKSGENYLTIQYEKLIPLLVEGIKELRREINQLKGK